MHTEVFNNIDILINMANSALSIEEINSELSTLKNQINTKRNDIEDLKSLMNDSRYFNASNELVDKNIEISLKNKINRLNRQIKELKSSLEEIKASEKSTHEDIVSLKERLDKNTKYVTTLETKTKNASSNAYYQELFQKEQQNVKQLNDELTKKEHLYQDILHNLELNNQAYKELSMKIEHESNRLKDVLDNLSNPNAYIDSDLKKNDEERLNNLTNDLNKLEKRRLELLTDANMVGSDAKKLIIDNDIFGALTKIKELVTIVKTKPYMDIASLSLLDEELEKKENLRVELSTLIDNKNYEEIDTDAVSIRTDYLKKEIETNKQSINHYQEEINTIDAFVNNTLGNNITSLEQTINKLESSINEYQNILATKTNPSRSKANLEMALTKKKQEKKALNTILDAYKEDLLSKISKTNIISRLIEDLNSTNNKYTKEIENLEKISLLDFKTRDFADEESDKEKLKQINDEIKAIKNRKKYDKTPDEIYDQIDMELASLKPANIPKKDKNDLENDNINDKDQKRLKVIEMIPVETIKKETNYSGVIGGN